MVVEGETANLYSSLLLSFVLFPITFSLSLLHLRVLVLLPAFVLFLSFSFPSFPLYSSVSLYPSFVYTFQPTVRFIFLLARSMPPPPAAREHQCHPLSSRPPIAVYIPVFFFSFFPFLSLLPSCLCSASCHCFLPFSPSFSMHSLYEYSTPELSGPASQPERSSCIQHGENGRLRSPSTSFWYRIVRGISVILVVPAVRRRYRGT